MPTESRDCRDGASVEQVEDRGMSEPTRLAFSIPLLPPSVNHYVTHTPYQDRETGTAKVYRQKSAEAKAWERDFGMFARDLYVVSQSGRFAVRLDFTPGPGESGDVDNYNKLPIDCCAKRGMLRDGKGKPKSDAWVKHLDIWIHDSPKERATGPRTEIVIEAMA
jgi:Holliday junction resolvase RusA-like endonuclease